jgi:hypothetical protein
MSVLGEIMASVIVLSSDWDRGDDPVCYYSTDPKTCLDFNSSAAKPRSALTEVRRGTMKDCEHGISYPVVICKVTS